MSRPKICPNCGFTHIAKILYGMPAFTPELERKLDKGEVILGGCCVGDNDPQWQCIECEQTLPAGLNRLDAKND